MSTVENIEEISAINRPKIDENGWTNLHVAAIENKIDEVYDFIEQWPNDINEEDIYGSTALHFAARWGCIRIVEVLIRHGADINAINHIGWSPLHCASWEGETDCVLQLLTSQNTTINCQSQQGWTPLHFAARWGYTDIAEALLDKAKAKTNVKDNEGQTAGHTAAIMGRAVVLHLLNDRKLLNLFDRNNEGKTIIDYALNNKNTFDFCVNMSNNYGLSFIQLVAIQENEELFKKVLKYHMHKSNAYKGIFPKNDFNTIGRLQEIDQIKRILQTDKQVIVTGISGIGKTAMIKYYAWTNQNYYKNNLYYVNCQNEEIFKKDFLKIAKHLKVPTKKYDTERDFKAITKDTFNNLKTKVGLLVFDNVSNIDDLEQYLGTNHEIDIIICGQEISGKIKCLNLQPLTETSALEYFEHLFQDGLLEESDRIKQLIRDLNGVPLALQRFKMQIMRHVFINSDFKSKILDQILVRRVLRNSVPPALERFKMSIIMSQVFIYSDSELSQFLDEVLLCNASDAILKLLNSLRYLNPSFITITLLLKLAYKLSIEGMSHVYFLISRSMLTVDNNYVQVVHKFTRENEYVGPMYEEYDLYIRTLILICNNNYSEHYRNLSKYAKTFNITFQGINVMIDKTLIEYFTMYGCLTTLHGIFEDKDKTEIMKYTKQYKLLHAAVKSGCIKTVELIYQYDNNVRKLNEKGHTLVWQAIELNHIEVLDFLISKGASLEHADRLNKTPLHRAAFLGRVDVVKLLLSKGVDPNITNKFVRTPLHYAAMEGHNEVIQVLFDHPDINIDARDHYRRSPVFETVRCYQLSTLRMFIEKGARIQTKDNLDLSPVRLAKLQANRDEILTVFREYGFSEDRKNEVCCPLLNIEIV